MKRTRHALALSAAIAVASAVLAPAASAASGPLAGTWTSIDTDGSNQTLTIVGSGAHVYSMSYFDDVASGACGGDPAMVKGPGYPDGDTLTMVGTLTCLPGGNVFRERLVLGYEYDAETDTLTDGSDVVWHRTG
ncbi:hypothetical protein FHX52_3705 [Humibacillus xanthopallidus]|uniref:Ig-like domain-containing protein n=1 Tax=Humibacillus xanthopallidus TaxID=412689 RepID=A0A543PK86_9MICO|nr:hypothetical protein [Humibacillus xanthopallidus]TQN44490.1 hypothetical protein FHX52_3705 [Humibacillus xanthopallidus]